MADVMMSNTAAKRAADALLRSGGGRSVTLRIPSPATPGDATEQLGLATPTFQDVELAPAVIRKARATVSGKAPQWEVLLSATAVDKLVGSLAYDSGGVLFSRAFGLLLDGTLLEIDAATVSQIFGAPYVYRLIVRAPLTPPM